MEKDNIIPEPISRWATTNVQDFYYPHLLYLQLQSMEIEETRQEIYRKIEEESNRRLELIREFFSSSPMGDLQDIEKSLDDWR